MGDDLQRPTGPDRFIELESGRADAGRSREHGIDEDPKRRDWAKVRPSRPGDDAEGVPLPSDFRSSIVRPRCDVKLVRPCHCHWECARGG